MKPVQKLSYLWLLFLFLSFPDVCRAVPPPDFIFNIGTQIATFFSFGLVFLAAITGTVYQFIKQKLIVWKKTKLFWIVSVVFILLIAGTGAYFYDQYNQRQAYTQWLEESKKYAESGIAGDPLLNTNTNEPISQRTDNLIGKKNEPVIVLIHNLNENKSAILDSILENGNANMPSLADSGAKFIEQYYGLIAEHQLDQAYAISSKSVSVETYRTWYNNAQAITLAHLTKIDEKRYSLSVQLRESGAVTDYDVLMTLKYDHAGQPVAIEDSVVKVVAYQKSGQKNINSDNNVQPEQVSNTFFLQHRDDVLFITNEAFKDVLKNNPHVFQILDAREDLEYENGHLPNSTHIRFADLKAGRWLEIPVDYPVYVLCWSGIRGKEVAEFLRSKEIAAYYIQQGADGWVKAGGSWEGNIDFSQKYTDDRYKLVFSTEATQKNIQDGIFIVDSRPPDKYADWHIPGSVNIPLMYTPTTELAKVFEQVPSQSKIITVCDDYVNCFDAKITGVELENRGFTFLGRYNKPWEYRHL